VVWFSSDKLFDTVGADASNEFLFKLLLDRDRLDALFTKSVMLADERCRKTDDGGSAVAEVFFDENQLEIMEPFFFFGVPCSSMGEPLEPSLGGKTGGKLISSI
jgi:hypothetical protein